MQIDISQTILYNYIILYMDMILDKKCEMCGAQLKISDNGLKAECPYCGSNYTYVKPVTAYSATCINRANNYRQRGMFDNAIVEYKTLLQDEEFANNAEIYWGLMLAEYGIEYVHDAREDAYVPTCHRTVTRSVFDDENYKKAIAAATEDMKAVYTARATEIDRVQQAIRLKAAETDGYEVFICFKASDNHIATQDRYIARRIFDELTKRGFRTFFSEVSLKDRLGSEYEPIIYKALMTARVMILIATKEEYLEAPFVRNEWSRFVERKKSDPSLSIVPVFGNIDPDILPTRDQGVDLAKYPAGGYEIDIADNLDNRLGKHAAVKVDKEILEEYSRYNEINRIKFEKEYRDAMRSVDISRKRVMHAGKAFAQKAEETEKLGDYKNAAALTADYRKKATFYDKAEKNMLSKMQNFNIVSTAVSLLLCVFVAVSLYMITSGPYEKPSYGIVTELGYVLEAIAAALLFLTALIYALLADKTRFTTVPKVTEIVLYTIAVVFMIYTLVLFAVLAPASIFPFILSTFVALSVLAANICKYMTAGLPEYDE